jgi:microcin C transport system permease protein
MALNPITLRRLSRFRSIKRAWGSLLILTGLTFLALLGPLLVGNQALIVSYQGKWSSPLLQGKLTGKTFGLSDDSSPNYRRLQKQFSQHNQGDWVVLPFIPFSPTEISEVNLTVTQSTSHGQKVFANEQHRPLTETKVFVLNPDGTRGSTWTVTNGKLDGEFRLRDTQGNSILLSKYRNGVALKTDPNGLHIPPASLHTFIPYPTPPGLDGHWLGTDESGHDVVARLYGGFQILLIASALYLVATYAIGILLGAAMGYFGGWFDLIMQRLIEIWSNIPFLYAIVFLATLFEPSLIILMLLLVAFSWMGLAHQMRAATYREASRDYVAASRSLGASHTRIILRHILPNTLSVMITLAPFSIAAVVASLSALDFLGFGLPPTVPSWGDLLRQGKENWSSWWIITSTVTCMVSTLIMVNFIGEGVRDAFDTKANAS